MNSAMSSHRSGPLTLVAVGAIVGALAPCAVGQGEPPARPAFKPNRADENWSGFTPPAEGGEMWDPIKNMRLGEDISLSLGGDLRFRMEHWENFSFA